MDYVWGKNAFLCYVPPRAGLKTVAFALTFAWTSAPGSSGGRLVETWRDHTRKGDLIRVQLGPYEHLVTVRGLSAKRGPASEAAALYEEDAASATRRAEVGARLKAESALFSHQAGRPSKKERRDLGKLRGKG